MTRHFVPIPSNPWSPVREEGYRCNDCGFLDSCDNDAKDYEAFRLRWSDPEEVMTAEQIEEGIQERRAIYEQQDREWMWPAEYKYVSDEPTRAKKLAEHAEQAEYTHYVRGEGETRELEVNQLPVNATLFAEILARPDDDAPRRAYADWIRTQDHVMAVGAAEFIEGQLRIWDALRVDPRADLTTILDALPSSAFERWTSGPDSLPDDYQWWQVPESGPFGLGGAFCDHLHVIHQEGLIADPWRARGFYEHVAIKASRFLEMADELYSLAPIRCLTLTYCKGHDHTDHGLWRALLASPHLARIRALMMPVTKFRRVKACTELNRFTDEDIELLAESANVRGLVYLDLQDQARLGLHAFDALARSPNLKSLSFVGHDLYSYDHPVQSTWGPMGKLQQHFSEHRLARYAKELEARHGQIPWLHPIESYGTEKPEVEAVLAHPVARNR